MKFMFFLLLFIFTINGIVHSQDAKDYIVVLDTLVNLDNFKSANKSLDIEQILKDKNKNLDFIRSLISDTKLTSMTKLLSNLDSNVKYLKTKRGIDFDVTNYQKLFVIRTNKELGSNSIDELKHKNKHIKYVFPDIQFSKDSWLSNDSLYQEQIQFYNTPYNINLPRA